MQRIATLVLASLFCLEGTNSAPSTQGALVCEYYHFFIQISRLQSQILFKTNYVAFFDSTFPFYFAVVLFLNLL